VAVGPIEKSKATNGSAGLRAPQEVEQLLKIVAHAKQ
jgi:hypothetical protein